jgi:hypothetical protein
MLADYGSAEAWQRAMTLRWFERLHPVVARPGEARGQPALANAEMID